MKEFQEKNQEKIRGVLSCFDRMLLRGYLPIQNGRSMAGFLTYHGVQLKNLKDLSCFTR